MLEDTENKYKLIEKYIQLCFSHNDLKRINKLVSQKLSLLDGGSKDTLFKFEKPVAKNKSIINKSKSPGTFQVERIYMQK